MKCKSCHNLPALLLLLVAPSAGQISIENPRSVDVYGDRAWVIYAAASEVVAEKFHRKHPAELQVPFKLVMGTAESSVFYDDVRGEYEIRLREWNDNEFAFCALRLTMQRLVTLQQRRELLTETLARARKRLPTSFAARH